MLICDTSGLLAYVDRDALRNDAVTAALEADRGPRIVSPFVLAELDYMVMTRLGVQAELAVLSELLSGAWQLEGLDPAELR
ncbi:MAG TPA: VapC toxin family PIN domain ribonuclease, partial [Chloroflexota bacterium]|nr:VapC toxin family PIN domain ribonuclease [Chloroflexota bacterium]